MKLDPVPTLDRARKRVVEAVSIDADFKEHYASSLAGIVLLAVWLFLSNAWLLFAYKVTIRA